jgi:hypothetical protein
LDSEKLISAIKKVTQFFDWFRINQKLLNTSHIYFD